LALAGCGPAPSASPHQAGLHRVASLAPSITEMVCALGGASQLVGRSSACDYPPNVVKDIPIVGKFGIPSLERLITVKPDAVLCPDLKDRALDEKLARIGVHPFKIACEKLDDIPPALIEVGHHLGRDQEARRQADALRAKISQCRATLPSGPKPRVLMLIWNNPLTIAGRNSFISELVTLAGGLNVGDEIGRDYFRVSSEWVLAHDPEIIFCFFMGNGKPVRHVIMQLPGWEHITAVRMSRVYDGFDNRLVLRPGPRVMEGVELLRARIVGSP
jgi:iron complex transport system substrate-binding protein